MSGFMDALNAAKAAITDDVVESEEKVYTGGGGFKINENGIHPVTITMATAKQSQAEDKDGVKSKSAWYEVTFENEKKQTVKGKFFVLNKKTGLPYKVTDEGEKRFMQGYNQMTALTYLTTGEAIGLPETEQKKIMEYVHPDGDMEVTRDVVMSLIGKKVCICIKMAKEDGYPDKTKPRDIAQIKHVCDFETKQFYREKLQDKEAKQAEQFVAANAEGTFDDNRDVSKDVETETESSEEKVTPANVGFGAS